MYKKVRTMEKNMFCKLKTTILIFLAYVISGCGTLTLPPATVHQSNTVDVSSYKYLIGAGDVVNIFVRKHITIFLLEIS